MHRGGRSVGVRAAPDGPIRKPKTHRRIASAGHDPPPPPTQVRLIVNIKTNQDLHVMMTIINIFISTHIIKLLQQALGPLRRNGHT